MGPPQRRAQFIVAAAFIIVAIVVSPVGIRLATGRVDLSPRITVLSLTFGLFLSILAGAILARGRLRRAGFHLLAWSFPLTLLAAIELGAIALRLADRVAPLEDLSVLANKEPWPAHLMSKGRREAKDGVMLYRPWQGDGIALNELGLRTALPSPKSAGEWRIAVTGGSAAWGWRVRDADTIPARLQPILRRQGHSNVTVYNFGIDANEIADELRLLPRFRELYAIDHVVFYTGANDVTRGYMKPTDPDDYLGLLVGTTAFELIKAAGRLKARLLEPPSGLLAELDNRVLPRLARQNALKNGLIAADNYCRGLTLRCDFILQPMLLARDKPRGSEIALARTLGQVYPRYREVLATMYRSALDTGLAIHDRSNMFDRSAEPYFFDAVHVNEAGNRFAAEQIAETIVRNIPGPGHRADTQ